LVVPDASVIVDYLLGTRPAAEQIARRLAAERELHAPHVLDLEVTQVLRRLAFRGPGEHSDAEAALSELTLLRLTRYPHGLLLDRIWELRDNLTAYDGAYVALTEMLGATLLTSDAGLAGAPGVRCKIELFA